MKAFPFLIAGMRRDGWSLRILFGALIGTWILAGAATFIALPRIAPPEFHDHKAVLESLGLLLMTTTVIPQVMFMTGDGVLVELGARSAATVRLIRIGAHLLVSSACGLAVLFFLPAQFDLRQLFGVWAGTWGLALLADTIGPPALGTALPAGCVLLFGLPRLIPWHLNVVFNPQRFDVLIAFASGVLLLGAATFALRGPLADRQP